MAITIETINTDWFNADALRLPSYKVGRVNFGAGRAYIRLNQDGAPCENPLRLYTSLTTAINSCAPMEQPLLEWYCKHGIEEAGRKLEIAQHYGTLMHTEIGRWLMDGQYDFSEGAVEAVVEDYLSQHSFYQPECSQWSYNLRKDVAAFCQFFFEYEVKPLGIEYVLLSEKGFGTLIDLVCEMTIQVDGYSDTEVYKSGPRKGQPKECKVDKRIRAIINFKSGRHGFYRTNGIQLEAERQLWEENFPDLLLDAAYNWSPKDWTGATPTYNLKDWTGDISSEEVDAILTLANIRYASKAERKQYTSISGVLSIADRAEGLTGIVKKEAITEFVNRKFGFNVGVSELEPISRCTANHRTPAVGNTDISSPVVNKPISSPLPI